MNSSRVVLVNILVILLIVGGAAAAIYYYYQGANYISTDNARIDGQAVTISAPASGQLVDWNGDVGKSYNAGDVMGAVQLPGGGGRVNVTSPIGATIVQQSAVTNAFVAPGTPLARSFNLNNLWITANIDETALADVKVDQTVDVYVDAFPGTTLTGRVRKVGLATAGTFSLLPASNTTANYTKVEQVIPVTISLDGYNGLALAPGMSATVRIHK